MVAQISFSQWQTEQRLTTNNGTSWTSYNNARCISASNGFVHTVWYASTTGNFNIYYERLTEAGLISIPIRISNSDSVTRFPSIASVGMYVHIIWMDSKNGSNNNEIYYRRSTDSGNTFLPETRLTNNAGESDYGSIAVEGNNVYVVWMDTRDNNQEIYFKRSTDNGGSWGSDVRLTNNSSNSLYPTIAVFNSNIHVAWSENRDLNFEIYYKRSTDGGANWGNDTRLTYDVVNSSIPSIAVNESKLHVVWTDERDLVAQIYYKKSTDNGFSWSQDIRLVNTIYEASEPNICVSGENIHVVWEDTRDHNGNPTFDIFYKHSTNGGVNWSNDEKITNTNGSSRFPFITYSNFSIHSIWHNDKTNHWEIYYKRNPTGNTVTNVNLNLIKLYNYSLYQNYPNPFNPATKINYEIKQDGFVGLKVYNVIGQLVKELVGEFKNAGNYEVKFNGSNLSSGMYFYRIESGEFVETKKMILIK